VSDVDLKSPNLLKDMARVQTDAFVEYGDEVELVFRRKAVIDDGAGGKKTTGETDLSAQEVRVVGARASATVVTADGKQRSLDKTVVGKIDLDIEDGDTFTYEGSEFEILGVNRDPGWRTSASAVRRG
jgi:hypothetical protein